MDTVRFCPNYCSFSLFEGKFDILEDRENRMSSTIVPQ